jgi:hypothetical protein
MDTMKLWRASRQQQWKIIGGIAYSCVHKCSDGYFEFPSLVVKGSPRALYLSTDDKLFIALVRDLEFSNEPFLQNGDARVSVHGPSWDEE